MGDVAIIVLLIVLILASMITIPYLLVRRSVSRVIKIFYRLNSLT